MHYWNFWASHTVISGPPERWTVMNPAHSCPRARGKAAMHTASSAANSQHAPRWKDRGVSQRGSSDRPTKKQSSKTISISGGKHTHRNIVRRIPSLIASNRLPRGLRRIAAGASTHCSRALLRAVQGRPVPSSASPSIPERTIMLKRRKSENALCTVIIVAQRLTKTNSFRHKNIRLNRSKKALPGLKTGN